MSSDEADFREKEAALFARISSPPSILENLTDFITKNEQEESENENENETKPKPKRQRS